jgi:hypothetical protein
MAIWIFTVKGIIEDLTYGETTAPTYEESQRLILLLGVSEGDVRA